MSALEANYSQLRAKAQGNVGAVVKADAYGLGASQVSVVLAKAGCDTFFVANCAEGVALRWVLPHVDIYVLDGVFPETRDSLREAGLLPVLNTPQQIQLWGSVGQPAAIHVDTGRHRLGLPVADAAASLPLINFDVRLLVSHLARADEPGHPSISEQLRRIQAVYAQWVQRFVGLRLSLSNSAGILRGVGSEQLTRAGIALYGGNPFRNEANPMRAVATLQGRVIQLRDVSAGEPLGYGGTFVTARKMRLAVLGLGYGDGYPRLLSNIGRVAVHGQLCPVVGRVSMDLTAVDVTHCEVSLGDWVEMFGDTVSVDEVAGQAQTIAYEVFTGLSDRLQRCYQTQ